MNKKTTDLALLEVGVKFTWGDVKKIHHIGPYAVVEFAWGDTWDNAGEVAFHPYFNGRETNTSYDSLDAALAGIIAFAHEGPNHRADGYFMRMIKGE